MATSTARPSGRICSKEIIKGLIFSAVAEAREGLVANVDALSEVVYTKQLIKPTGRVGGSGKGRGGGGNYRGGEEGGGGGGWG